MRRRAAFALLAASGLAAVIVIALGTRSGLAQSGPPQAAVAPAVPQTQSTHSLGNDFNNQRRVQDYSSDSAEALLHTPVSKLSPGGSSQAPQLQNPVAGDPGAAQRGMKYFESFNCVGCHAPNGGGGMGPALSNRVFIYGSKPAEIYLSILQGRPNGMPAWGNKLSPDVIWDLVTYIEGISKAPDNEWGTTISPNSPSYEQVPAEFGSTTEPWSRLEPFSVGQKPEGVKK